MSAVVSDPAPRSIHPSAPNQAPLGGIRGLFARLTHEPNAIWMREMRQAARLGRTPWILFSITITISLLMCAIGGIAAAESASPAVLGGALFQVFFSIAYFVVVVVGPAVAANSIASEREGRTWEAVLLTGLSPKEIARGKFLAAYTTIALYIVVLAPVGALPFLFGGVTATEVVVAFVILFIIAALSVAFGLAVSSLMSSLRGAIVVTLMLAICLGPMLYVGLGFGCSFVLHKQWDGIPEGFPIWLPLAYERATFGIRYVLLLVVVPVLALAIPAWFLYEATIANLTGEGDDRSTGLKRWFAVCTPLLALAATIPSVIAEDDDARMAWGCGGIIFFAGHAVFCALLFAFEPPGPSRRVRVHWDRRGAGPLRRFFGPGLTKGAVLIALFGVVGIIGIAAVAMAALKWFGTGTSTSTSIAQVFVFSAYAAPFFLFIVGFNTWLRARNSSPWVTRLINTGVLFLIAAAPWVVAAVGGVLTRGNEKAWLAIAAPSPFYAFAMTAAVDDASGDSALLVSVGIACASGWGLLGLVLLAAGARRCSKMIAEHDAAYAKAEAALVAEEAALVQAANARSSDVASEPVGAMGE